jgi:transmembrane sensor
VTPRAREVWLDEGEAFFDIAHDARRPFVVHAGSQTVTVLGTKFSLLRDGDQLRVAVLEGRVQVKAPRGNPTVLTRDDAALAERDNVLVTRKSTQQLKAGLSWMQGKLVFDQATLADAARQFNRYGRKQLVIEDDAAARIGIGGVFDADNVEAFARLLHVGFGLEVDVVGDEIRVSSPGT